MMPTYLHVLWSGIFGHHFLFAYGLGLPFVFEYAKDLRGILRVSISVVTLVVLSVVVNGLLFTLFFRTGAFSWLGLPYFNFGFLNYFAYLGVVFFIADWVPGFLKKQLNSAFLGLASVKTVIDAISVDLSQYRVRFLAFGICLFADYFMLSFPQYVAFGTGAGLGFGVALASVWCVTEALRKVDTLKTVPDFALKMGILGVIALAFSIL